MELQSGFVLAVLVAAVLLADRIGGADELARRLFQVALAALLAFMVVSGTTAFIRSPGYQETQSAFSSGSDSDALEELADRNTAKASIHVGAGIVALVLGITWLRRLSTLPVAVVTAGVLLILFGSVARSPESSADPLGTVYSTFLGLALGSSSATADIAHFVMMLAGSVALMLFGYREWERDGSEPEEASV